jgi:hypothetical protein
VSALGYFISGLCASAFVVHALNGTWIFAAITFVLAAINGLCGYMNWKSE